MRLDRDVQPPAANIPFASEIVEARTAKLALDGDCVAVGVHEDDRSFAGDPANDAGDPAEELFLVAALADNIPGRTARKSWAPGGQ